MTFRRVLASLVVLALFPAAAQAHTTIIEPPGSPHPYQAWVDQSDSPTPEVTLNLVEVSEPCGVRDTVGCTDGTSTIELAANLSSPEARRVFFHELGHVFDQEVLTPGERERETVLLHRGGDPWEPMVEEAFADSYSWCARLHRFERLRYYEVEQARVTGADLEGICRSLRSDMVAYDARPKS
jgi:hypothetical protein